MQLNAEKPTVSLVTHLSCVNCQAEYAEGQADVCPQCGIDDGILDVCFDLTAAGKKLTRAALAERPLSIWRYHEVLPVDGAPPAGLEQIGWTPLIEAPCLAADLGIGRLRLKDA
ncbi:MAG: threonine synthase, partial [Planctomycetes bacterium]|nr:threonine synthase [Planctomycetota bacterium]